LFRGKRTLLGIKEKEDRSKKEGISPAERKKKRATAKGEREEASRVSAGKEKKRGERGRV